MKSCWRGDEWRRRLSTTVRKKTSSTSEIFWWKRRRKRNEQRQREQDSGRQKSPAESRETSGDVTGHVASEVGVKVAGQSFADGGYVDVLEAVQRKHLWRRVEGLCVTRDEPVTHPSHEKSKPVRPRPSCCGIRHTASPFVVVGVVLRVAAAATEHRPGGRVLLQQELHLVAVAGKTSASQEDVWSENRIFTAAKDLSVVGACDQQPDPYLHRVLLEVGPAEAVSSEKLELVIAENEPGERPGRERLGKVDVQDSKHRLHLRGLGNLQWSGLSALTKFKKLRKLVSCQFLANFSNFNLTFGNYLLWDSSNRIHLSSVCSLFLCLVETITTKPSLPLYLC